MSEFKKFPKVKVLPIPIDDEKCSQKCGYSEYETHIVKTEKWCEDTQQKLEKAKTMLNEILDSELMKQVQKVIPRVRDRWEGQLGVVEELLEALK